ncbi:cation transporter [Halobacteriales archaeon QS_1_68_17]|nr:MAG: cation transporter [Halobacteriales archaeon QS_1_68_17]
MVFAVLWLFVRGVELAVDPVVGQFLLGLAVGLPVAYVFRRLYAEAVDLRRSLGAVPAAALYLLTFAREIVVANFDVAYRVVAPDMPIEPQVILVPLRVETDLGVTTIANSITITPGTITLDHDPDRNALYVHVIDGRNVRSVVDPIRTWEDYALDIFDEPASPADPAPEITVHPPDHESLPPAVRATVGTAGGPPDRDAGGRRREESNDGSQGDDSSGGPDEDETALLDGEDTGHQSEGDGGERDRPGGGNDSGG